MQQNRLRSFRLIGAHKNHAGVIQLLHDQGFEFEALPFLGHAFRLTHEPFPLGSSLAARFGHIYIQDASSMLPSIALYNIIKENNDAERELCILDMCSSPGGKSSLLADLLGHKAFILSNEPSTKRLANLRRNLESLNHLNCATCSFSGEAFPLPTAGTKINAGSRTPSTSSESTLSSYSKQPADFAGWDYILLDPPCSGWGTVEKNPQVMELWQGDKVKPLVLLQKQLIYEAARLLKPGGCMVYSTCTVNPQENEEQVNWALAGMPLAALRDSLPIAPAPKQRKKWKAEQQAAKNRNSLTTVTNLSHLEANDKIASAAISGGTTRSAATATGNSSGKLTPSSDSTATFSLIPLQPFSGFIFDDLPDAPGTLRVSMKSDLGQGFYISALRKTSSTQLAPIFKTDKKSMRALNNSSNTFSSITTNSDALTASGNASNFISWYDALTSSPNAAALDKRTASFFAEINTLPCSTLNAPLQDATALPQGLLLSYKDGLAFYHTAGLQLLPASFPWRGFNLGKNITGSKPRLITALPALMPDCAMAAHKQALILNTNNPGFILRLLSGQSITLAELQNSKELQAPLPPAQSQQEEAGLYYKGLPLCRLKLKNGRVFI